MYKTIPIVFSHVNEMIVVLNDVWDGVIGKMLGKVSRSDMVLDVLSSMLFDIIIGTVTGTGAGIEALYGLNPNVLIVVIDVLEFDVMTAP